MDPSLSCSLIDPEVEKRIDELLSGFSVPEKIGQLCQETAEAPDAEALRERIRRGEVGSLILASTPFAGNEAQIRLSVAELNALQRVAVEESPWHIPLLFGRDVIHGHRTVFPVPLGQACGWDPDLVQSCSAAAANEAAAAGVHWTFSPMLDIARDPRWGRIVEGYGEDPFLVGELGAAAVTGYQKGEPGAAKSHRHVAACAKHFLGYGAAEGGRDYDTTEITDHTLRNVYLPPFVRAIQAGCLTVMSAFNEINGETSSGSHRLLTGMLKQDLGFDGFVVSDWASVRELIDHGLAADEAEAGRIGFAAGVDMEMVTTCFRDSLAGHLASGRITTIQLDEAVRRILRVKIFCGLFETPYTPEGENQPPPAHRTLARDAAARSVVLLKNQHANLPLRPIPGKTLLTGPLLTARSSLLGTWAMDGNPDDVVSYQQAFTSGLGAEAIISHDPHLLDAGLALARHHLLNGIERIVVFLGEDSCRSGEHFSVADLELPVGQVAYVEALAATGLPVIAVVTAGRPVLLDRIQALCSAVVFSFHGGVEAGNGVWDVLSGAREPVGRLPVTFPRNTGQIPIYYNRKRVGRPWARAYVDASPDPLFPFGFGLTYTQFVLQDLNLEKSTWTPTEHLSIALTVKNTGTRDGSTVIQFYAHDRVASASRPERFLCGFRRVTLPAGESVTVTHSIPCQTLSFYNLDGQRQVEPGEFMLYAGEDSHADLGVEFTVTG